MKHRLTLCFYFTFFRFFLSSAHCTLSLLVTSTLWPSVNIFSLGDLSNSFRFSVIFSKHRLFPPSYSPLHHSPPPPPGQGHGQGQGQSRIFPAYARQRNRLVPTSHPGQADKEKAI